MIDPSFKPSCTTDRNTVIKWVGDKIEGHFVGKSAAVGRITHLLQHRGIMVSNVWQGSILISFRCFTEKSLGNLKRLYTDKTLDKLFTQVFCPQFTQQLESLTLNITDEEFIQCAERFRQTALMTDEHRETLLQAAETASDMISNTKDLFGKLSLCKHRMKTVLASSENRKQVKTLFEIISRQPDRMFTQLINALRETGQDEAADYIDNYSADCDDRRSENSDDSDIEHVESTNDTAVNSSISQQSTQQSSLQDLKASDGVEQLQQTEQTSAVTQLTASLLELVLMKTFIKLFTDDYKTHEAKSQSYSSLAAVCFTWWQTMTGGSSLSPKHQLICTLKSVCRPYRVSPRQQFSRPMSSCVFGVTQCDNKLFVVCISSNTIYIFGPNNKQQAKITLKELNRARDLVSCAETKQLYVAGWSTASGYCVWRVSLNGRRVVKWLPNKSTSATSQFSPYTLSVTSRRLLVTSRDNNELLLYGADGVELERVPLPDMLLRHAVETSRGTFIVCYTAPRTEVCEVDVDGHTICVYSDQQLSTLNYLSLDSDGRVFVADSCRDRILLLNSRLELERVLLDKQQHKLADPWRLCYSEQTGQLVVASGGKHNITGCVQLFTVRSSMLSQTSSTTQGTLQPRHSLFIFIIVAIIIGLCAHVLLPLLDNFMPSLFNYHLN